MRSTFISLCIAITSLAIPDAHSENTNLPITFYIVSQQQIEVGRTFDAKPDLTVTQLKAVSLGETREYTGTSEDAKTGGTQKLKMIVPGWLVFTLTDEDFQLLKTLTHRPVGDRLVAMVGDQRLGFWRIEDTPGGPEFRVPPRTIQDKEKLPRMERELKKLVK
jgi:hypothetical protein